ncbi:GyrI-like domain-containing protein [Photobacterium sp. MCCC 1A19761]|uniref:GyrI-like domain-containing protein n=1 Tax=Photobacterium sp. MCCC 1A19761 TaxID=3115000 RepID=UPI00307D2A3A
MILQHIDGFEVSGFSVRTTNADEMSPSTAKIGQLWETFYAQAYPKLTAGSNIYGVYTHYESDHTGAYDVMACSDGLAADALNGAVSTQIASGKYLTFTAQGEMPQAVISLWGTIWDYFRADDCAHTRAYTTDFEHYLSADEVAISIAIQ